MQALHNPPECNSSDLDVRLGQLEHYTLNPDLDCKSCSISLQTIIRLLYHFASNKFLEDLIMKRSERDKYWMELIQTCRVSGLSDYEWCRMRMVKPRNQSHIYGFIQAEHLKNTEL